MTHSLFALAGDSHGTGPCAPRDPTLPHTPPTHSGQHLSQSFPSHSHLQPRTNNPRHRFCIHWDKEMRADSCDLRLTPRDLPGLKYTPAHPIVLTVSELQAPNPRAPTSTLTAPFTSAQAVASALVLCVKSTLRWFPTRSSSQPAGWCCDGTCAPV